MDQRNTSFPFSVFGRVDLNTLFLEWEKEPENGDYPEPKKGWLLKYTYVFRNRVCALVFENLFGRETGITCYRVMFFRGEGDTFRTVRKIRFREDGFRSVGAIGINWELDLLFVRSSGPENGDDIRYYAIGEGTQDLSGIGELKDVAIRQSGDRFALVDNMNVLFFRAPDKCRIEFDLIDPHDILSERGQASDDMEDEFDDVDDDVDDDDDEDDERGDNTRCRIQPEMAENTDGKSALEQLNEMIGLEEIKEQIKNIIAFSKLQKKAAEQGRTIENINLNIAFLGNPGTAKTSVARLFARIMKENGLLSKGGLIEAGRADLVAKYTGQTAIKVKELFSKAKGHVLFIDEAYSLVDSWENEFGDEAIAAIVQELENNRGDMVVIFAGYPDKMEQFLSRNPGLRSRVPFTVAFSDYSADELTAIAKSEAARRGYTIEEEAEQKIRAICSVAMKEKEFGNGRFCRNLVESAIMKAASRTMEPGAENSDMNACFELKDCDFAAPSGMKRNRARVIGFCAA